MGIFEDAYQQFLREGGFSKPAVREDLEREYRDTVLKIPDKCPHGLTLLTCGECDFNKDADDHGGYNYE